MSEGRTDPGASGRPELRTTHGPRNGGGRVRIAWMAAVLLLMAVPAGVVLAARDQDEALPHPDEASLHQQDEPFPHEEHAGLFPLCTGCHAGIPEDDPTAAYPEPAACAECHDGEELERVQWTRPEPRASNLTFAHVHHAEEMAEEGEEELQCESCHSVSLEEERMVVERGRVGECLSCHAPEAEGHFETARADADCSVCHVSLAESGFGLVRLEALPEPDDHDDPGFLGRIHGEAAADDAARCATCHVQDRCASCHVDAGRDEIAAVPPAPPDMALPRFEAEYPTPEIHEDPAWPEGHARNASRESCATCHTRDDCAACHQEPVPTSAEVLPRRTDVRAPGASLARRAPESHYEPEFASRHGTVGSVRSSTCAGCHTETFCSSCHDGFGSAGPWDESSPGPETELAEETVPGGDSGGGRLADPTLATASMPEADPSVATPLATSSRATYRHDVPATFDTVPRPPPADPGRRETLGNEDGDPGFHPPNYAVRHTTDAWGRTLECANCHSTEVFCRSCHLESGTAGRGRVGPGYHDAIPLWLFRHGRAARQGLESCASCHTETQCLRCHSSVGAFRVSPHGPDFDPERTRERNAQACRLCHLTDPLEGPEP